MMETLQFDQFQRYATASRVIGALVPGSEASRVKILEVGGNSHGNLRKFFPEASLVLLDKEPFSFAGTEIESLVGTGSDLPFSDREFDFVVALDVLEHVEEDQREQFIAECCRVAGRAVVLAFPCGEGARRMEDKANDFWKSYFSREHPWLWEHFANGLPEPEKVLSAAGKSKLDVNCFRHGDLALWRTLMESNFLGEACPEVRTFVDRLNEYYNRNLAEEDFDDNGYRLFVVLSRRPEDSEKISRYVASLKDSSEVSGAIPVMEAFKELGQLFVDRKREMERVSRQAEVKEHELQAVYATLSWRLTRPLRELNLVRRRCQAFAKEIDARGGIRNSSKKLLRKLKLNGYRYVAGKIREVALSTENEPISLELESRGDNYAEWIKRYDTLSEAGRKKIEVRIKAFKHRPLFSVVMPVFDPPVEYLEKALESVRGQLYPDWELCVADDASQDPGVRELLECYSQVDPRIKVVFRRENGHISRASNSALELVTGEYVVLLDHDDLLPETALFWAANEINLHPDAELIYSDEDKVDAEGNRYDAYFKCDWNPDLFLSQNMFSHLGVYRTELVRRVGGFRTGFEGSQDYDLVLRCLDYVPENRIRHIPRVLYHWRAINGSTAKGSGQKSYAYEAGMRALNDYCRRNAIPARVDVAAADGCYRVRYRVPKPRPKVTLVIPTRDQVAVLRRCVDSILEKTRYPEYEILIVDNGSRESETLSYLDRIQRNLRIRVFRDERPFNYSALNNLAVGRAEGEIVGLLNNDVEVISPGWMRELVSHACRSEVGAVGALLLYHPGERIQHAGVIVGIGGVAGHGHKNCINGSPGYCGRAYLLQSFSALTGACLFVRKKLYEEVGGLDEKNLSIAFNDIDFCLRLRELGYRNIWTPYAKLYHHESVSRGSDTSPENLARFNREVDYMRAKWNKLIAGDPAYSPNLTLYTEDFSLAWPPRIERL